MQSSYPAAFDREVGGTEADWLMRLPGAVGAHALTLGPGQARVDIGGGALRLAWQVLPPRRIALVRLERMAVSFRFDGVDDDLRHAFMRRFDLYMQRGGG